MRSALWSAGLRGWRIHGTGVVGRPDIYFPRWRVAVFVDGAFWHGHPSRFRPGRAGPWWDAKIASNVKRDQHVNAALVAGGWRVVRLWDFDVANNPETCVRQIRDAVSHARFTQPRAAGSSVALPEVEQVKDAAP